MISSVTAAATAEQLLDSSDEEEPQSTQDHDLAVVALEDALLAAGGDEGEVGPRGRRTAHTRQDLLLLLHARRFDVERAVRLAKTMRSFYAKHPTWEEGDPRVDARLREALASGVHQMLPNRDREGRLVLAFYPQRLVASLVSETTGREISMEDHQRGAFFLAQQAVRTDEVTQQKGLVFLVCLEGLTFRKAVTRLLPRMGRADLTRGTNMAQGGCLPLRVAGVWVVGNPPMVSKLLLGMLRPFLRRGKGFRDKLHLCGAGEKGRERVRALYGCDGGEEQIPEEIGGGLAATAAWPTVVADTYCS